MKLQTTLYVVQQATWPAEGRHILAQYDGQSIIVYQAYRPSIGSFAAQHGYFGGEFSFTRMSWIKPNFLWMMYRSNWGQAESQEAVLGIRLKRAFFESLLEKAVPSSFQSRLYANQEDWKAAVTQSEVRLQWDPDHLPTGQPCERRAIQIGLRGQALDAYGQRDIIEVIDMRDFVAEQRKNVPGWADGSLLTPSEWVYKAASPKAAMQIGLEKN